MKIKVSKKEFEVEVANSIWKKIKGLMFKQSGNMLMDFGKDSRPGIWMFGMKFPIDIVYVNSEMKVVDVKNAKPMSFNPLTWRVYYPKEKSRYVLEVEYESGVKRGDILSIQ